MGYVFLQEYLQMRGSRGGIAILKLHKHVQLRNYGHNGIACIH